MRVVAPFVALLGTLLLCAAAPAQDRTRIVILPNDHLETPHFEVQRLRDDSPEVLSGQSSYEMTPAEVEDAQPVSATRTRAPLCRDVS